MLLKISSLKVPLILSKRSTKKAKTNLNFENNRVIVLNQVMKMKITKSGHYAVPISRYSLDNGSRADAKNISLATEDMDVGEKQKVCKKLPIQLGHPMAVRLKQLLQEAKIEDRDLYKIVIETEENYETC